jgi:ribosome-associated protein
MDKNTLPRLAIAVALDKKAVRPVLLDLRQQTSLTEYFAIVSASNSRQVYAIADSVQKFLKETFHLNPLSTDGFETCHWILLDYGFFYFHVFQESTRSVYQLEQLWSKGRYEEVTEDECASLLKVYNPV